MDPLAETFSTGDPVTLLSVELSQCAMGKVDLSLMIGLHNESMTAANNLSQLRESRLLRREHSATHFRGPVG